MKKQDFTVSITVNATAQEVFNAINNVRGWWSGEPGIEGSTGKLGDEFTYRYEPYHYSKQKITEFVPGKKVVWTVTDSNLSFVKDKNEWTGTKIIFDISKKAGKTEVCFTHVGLVPKIECYDGCSNAWGQYIHESLFKLLTKEKEKPELI
jgi:uncharacterized protein YndB with AHSA1/START domain